MRGMETWKFILLFQEIMYNIAYHCLMVTIVIMHYDFEIRVALMTFPAYDALHTVPDGHEDYSSLSHKQM